MKLKFKLDINTINNWFRPCYFCTYFSRSQSWRTYESRECSYSGNSNTRFMVCYTNEGKQLPMTYRLNFTDKLNYIKL